MAIAEMLGKFEWEILEYMPTDEYARWVAYIKISNEKMSKGTKRGSGSGDF